MICDIYMILWEVLTKGESLKHAETMGLNDLNAQNSQSHDDLKDTSTYWRFSWAEVVHGFSDLDR